jgi:hypothetical protein
MQRAGLPIMPFHLPPLLVADGGLPAEWPLQPLQSALDQGIIPLNQRRRVFDHVRRRNDFYPPKPCSNTWRCA